MSSLRDRSIGIAALGLSGVAAYLFLAIAGRSLGAADFSSIGALWAVVFLATAALAAPLEMAVARDVGTARGRGAPLRPSVREGFVLSAIVAISAIGAALLAGGWLDSAVFGGQPGFSLAAGVAFAGLTVGAAAKGACAGGNRLAGWGGYSLVDGGTRLGLSVVAAMIAPHPASFALALAVGPWLGLAAPAVSLRRLLASDAGHAVRGGVAALARSTAPLVVAAAASAALTYLGAVMLPVLVPGPNAQVGAYIAALALARLPLFAFSPLVAIAVPRIASALETGDAVAARRTAAMLMAIAAAGGLVVVVLSFVAGGGSLASLFGADFSLPAASLAAIGVASACWLLATAATSVAIAAGHGRLAAAAWFAGLVGALAAAAAAGPGAFDRTDAAVVLGALVAVIGAGLAAIAALSSQRGPPRAAT